MKRYNEWPVDGNKVEAPVGSYLVVLDTADYTPGSIAHIMRIHRRVEKTNTDGSKALSYDVVYPHDLSVAGTYDKSYYVFEGTDAFTRLEPLMNLMGTRQGDSYCPAFVLSEEELRTVLGIGDGEGKQP